MAFGCGATWSAGHPVVQNSWSAVQFSVVDAEVDAWLSSVCHGGSISRSVSSSLTVLAWRGRAASTPGVRWCHQDSSSVSRRGLARPPHYTAQLAASPLRVTFFRWSGLVPCRRS
jgi:hypothetical protein